MLSRSNLEASVFVFAGTRARGTPTTPNHHLPDQARAILAFVDQLAERRARSVTTLTAPRGRGKSAALGLCLAAAVATGYASIFARAPRGKDFFSVCPTTDRRRR